MASVLAVLLVFTGNLSSVITVNADTCGGLEEVDVYQPKADEVIKDPILHWAIRAAMNAIKSDVKLTADMVGDASVKDISYELCAHPEDFANWTKQYWLEDLEGLQYAKSAKMIDICYTDAVDGKKIKSLEPLAPLVQLETLYLKQDGLTDISPIKTLVNLTELDLSGNKNISDISATADMKKLKRMNVSINNINNIDAVSGLVNLEYADFSKNQIKELPDMSKLTRLTSLDLSHNKLTDVSALKDVKTLNVLNLAGNSGVTDLKPLAGLVYLDKDLTYLPDNSKKDDLFAAIEVNKLFRMFNISQMKESDLDNVRSALDAYEALTSEQKGYMDAKRIEAARNNMNKVQNGQEPDYYPEYDEEGEKQPVLDRIEAKVVDKYGKPMAGVSFDKERDGVLAGTLKTNDKGILSAKHSTVDSMYNEIVLKPSGDTYVAIPDKISYTVNFTQKTETINQKEATGLEELTFVLHLKDEYVDKKALEEVIKSAKGVEEQYKYTADSWKAYDTALQNAKAAFGNIDVTKPEVEKAVSELKNAIANLKKTNILTQLKIVVRDKNGNLFTRPFKFQIRVPGTGAEAWNDLSNAETGTAYLKVSPAWQDGKEWEILACHEEPYTFTPFKAVIGVKNGQRYFKSVDGKAVDVDFAKEITVIYKETENSIRKPDSSVLEKYVENALIYNKEDYTTSSWKALQLSIDNAKAAIDKSGAQQEDYNKCAAELKKAEEGLLFRANKAELKKVLNEWYNETSYTAGSWIVYASARKNAQKIMDNTDATQKEVDDAIKDLRAAQQALVLRADTSKLTEILNKVKTLNEGDYIEGWEKLQEEVKKAEEIINDSNVTQKAIDNQVTALENALDALIKKPAEVVETCDPSVFRAVVQDAKGKRLSGIHFSVKVDGKIQEDETLVSDANGIITFYTWSGVYKKIVTIELAEEGYTTSDVHEMKAGGGLQFSPFFTEIDGKPYEEGLRLTYTLTKEGGEEVDITELEQAIVDAKQIKKGNYTTNSFSALLKKIKEAEKLLERDEYTQEEINAAKEALNAAVNALKEVTGMRKLVIRVEGEDGVTVADNFEIVRYDVHYNVENKLYANEGSATWTLTDYDAGDWEFYLPKSSAYVATPGLIKVHVGLEEGSPVIETINGKPAAEATAKFRISAKGTESSDLLTFRALVQDEKGNALSGIKFDVQNGDPNMLISDENGIIEYPVSMWDADTEMTVTLQDGQKWISDQKAVFTVVADPEDPDRAIIGTVNGKPLAEAEKVVLTLKEEKTNPEKPDPEKPDPGKPNPDNPNHGEKPEKPEISNKKPDTNNNVVKTGDSANAIPFVVGMAVAVAAILMVLKKKKVNK